MCTQSRPLSGDSQYMPVGAVYLDTPGMRVYYFPRGYTMNTFKVAIFGGGTVGGGVARILRENSALLERRAGCPVELVTILDLFPSASSKRHGIPLELYCGNGGDLNRDEASKYMAQILSNPEIDAVVETIGGSSDYILQVVLDILHSKKHLVTANKALLAKHGTAIMRAALANQRAIGFEASVCGAIPVIKGINDCMSGDKIESVSGIMNGTSNYILTKMSREGLSFYEALKGAQAMGYAEADPTLDINGGDAGHKLSILLRILYGIETEPGDIPVSGIDTINAEDTRIAEETDAVIKLICYAQREQNGVCATVQPMMVKKSNVLSDINNATNAVKLVGAYSRENLFVGQGAGSLETGSAIVSDIVYIARYGTASLRDYPSSGLSLVSFDTHVMPYTIIFDTEDVPGITGIVTTAIGKQEINIDTVSHNMRVSGQAGALFSIVTKPCTLTQIKAAVRDMQQTAPSIFVKEPKIIPVLS